MEKLLIIEDDEAQRTQIKWGLRKEYDVYIAADRESALEIIEKETPRVVTLDLGLPPQPDSTEEGFACLAYILENYSQTNVIVITGNTERESALKAVEMGAYDFYQKPINMSELKTILKRAFHLSHIEEENRKMQGVISSTDSFEGIISGCSKILEVFRLIEKVAASDATVLIIGGSGTGKEMVARAIHNRSLRKNNLFVPINCGGIPDTLIESELFGYEKGAFTDAKTQKIGLVERAKNGTLFLDEISELPVQLQVKLLRFLQDRKIQRLGGHKEIEIDTRIIAATNIDLQMAIKEGIFREDLYYRISVISVQLPPLTERENDIMLLANSFLNKFNYINKKNIKGFSPEAIELLESYEWPGNVRELENKIQQAVIMADGNLIRPKDLSLGISSEADKDKKGLSLREIRKKAERKTIRQTLIRSDWNISKAAEELGISRPTLHGMIKKYKIKTKQ